MFIDDWAGVGRASVGEAGDRLQVKVQIGARRVAVKGLTGRGQEKKKKVRFNNLIRENGNKYEYSRLSTPYGSHRKPVDITDRGKLKKSSSFTQSRSNYL